jgi:uncharacterized protein YkwD
MSRACPHILAVALAVLCATFLGAGAADAGPGCPSASAMPAQAGHDPLVEATLCLLNDQRDRRGLPPLRANDRLSDAAQRHARDMARRNYFSHDSRSGASFIDRIRRTGYLDGARSWIAAENIAWGTGRFATPKAIVKSWMDSPGHRANILSSSLREIGIGVAEDPPIADAGPGGTYATDFGKRD